MILVPPASIPTSGEMLAIVGSVIPTSGEMLDIVGSVIPTSGEMLAVVGSDIPTSGEILAIVGSVIPTPGEILAIVGSGPAKVLDGTRTGRDVSRFIIMSNAVMVISQNYFTNRAFLNVTTKKNYHFLQCLHEFTALQ